MRKKRLTLVAAAAMTFAMSMTAFAEGTWQHDDTGWRWLRFPDMLYINQWKWIDSDADGIAECYYFGPRGYIYTNTTTPDGYTVDQDGKWVVDGIVQSKEMVPGVDDVISTTAPDVSNAVRDPNAIEKITSNDELFEPITLWGSTGVIDMTKAEYVGFIPNIGDGFFYYDYNGINLRLQAGRIGGTGPYNISSLFGPAKAFFNNIPESGIELYAFFDSSEVTGLHGFRDWDPVAHSGISGPTGNLPNVFETPTSSLKVTNFYRYAEDGTHTYMKPTQGADGKWYIFPDTPTYVITS